MKRKYTINENYFDKIDTSEKAYWLGWLYADGCNMIKYRNVTINLQIEDKYILENFQRAINSNKPLTIISPKGGFSNGNKIARSTVTNINFCRSLEKVGMMSQKSLTLKFPDNQIVPPNLISHFIRGYFEGDGTIYNNIMKQSHISFSLNKDFAHGLKEMFSKLGINCYIKKDGESGIQKLTIGGRLQTLKALDWIYKDSEGMRLDRKYAKYILMKNYKPNKTNATSQYKGVFFEKNMKKFISYFRLGKEYKYRIIYIGYFSDELEAAKAYDNYLINNKIGKPLNF